VKVIQNPERAPVRGRDQVVVALVNQQPVHRDVRHVVLRDPGLAAVDRHMDALSCPRKRRFVPRMLCDRVHRSPAVPA
jgi:hypothetical protein